MTPPAEAVAMEDLKLLVADALEMVRGEAGVLGAEVFASWNEQLIARLNYTSEISCNGVHEPKSTTAAGLGVLATFQEGGELRVGFGSEQGAFSVETAKRAMAKARRNAVHDPHFHSLPAPSGERPRLKHYHDARVLEIDDETLVDLGWQALEGALLTFKEAGELRTLIVNGDVTILKERMAIASTTGIHEADDSTLLMATITSMIEKEEVKGTGWANATHLDRFRPEEAGREAARSAIQTIGGRRIESGRYAVVFGRQAVTEITSNLLMPSLSLDTIDACSSPFVSRLGERVAVAQLSVADDGSLPGEMASKRVTCEGLPTGRTDLIDHGVLVGFLADDYTSKKLSNTVRTFVPRNGFRFSGGGGRNFRQRPGIFPTNVLISGEEELEQQELLRLVGTGVYIGRLWYTYPIHGLGPGDFTGTVVGDSYLIEGGRLGQPLRPNTVRVNDNFKRLLHHVTGIGLEKKAALVWGSEEIVLAPEIAVSDVQLENMATFLA